MSYTPTAWVTGDTVTPAKLNKIEQGIYASESSSDAVFHVNANETYVSGNWRYVMDHTFNEIRNAIAAGKTVTVTYKVDNDNTMVDYSVHNVDKIWIDTSMQNYIVYYVVVGYYEFHTTNADGYPPYCEI